MLPRLKRKLASFLREYIRSKKLSCPFLTQSNFLSYEMNERHLSLATLAQKVIFRPSYRIRIVFL